MPADPLSIGLAVGGSALKSFAKRKAAKKRDKILAQSIARRSQQQEEMDALLMAEVGNRRAETPETERAAAMNEFVGQLRTARAGKVGSLGARGTVSDRETGALRDLEGQIGEFAGREADITARLDSQARMRDKQDLRLGRTGTTLQQKARLMDSADFLDQLRLARVRPNKWMSALGSIAQGFGNAGALGSFGGGGLRFANLPSGATGGGGLATPVVIR